MSVEQNKIVAARFFEEVFNNKKIESVDELVASDVLDHNKIIFAHEPFYGGRQVREGNEEHTDAFGHTPGSFRLGEGDYVVAKVRMAGTNTGPYPRAPSPQGGTPSGNLWYCSGWRTAR